MNTNFSFVCNFKVMQVRCNALLSNSDRLVLTWIIPHILIVTTLQAALAATPWTPECKHVRSANNFLQRNAKKDDLATDTLLHELISFVQGKGGV